MEAEIWRAHVATTQPIAGCIRTGVVFVDAHERTVRRTGWTVPHAITLDLAAFRGIVYALWNARRLGPRRVIVYCDNPSVVAQINGRQDVDPALVGPYLEVRALLHAYRSARVEVQGTRWGREALEAAEAAHGRDTDEIVEDLPLWARHQVGDPSIVG